jgi:hydroxymethylglutaryl-CoA synthase
MSDEREPVGLSDIRLSIPSLRMDLERIVDRRSLEDPSLRRHLERAMRVTGQRSIRFPEIWQDTATMAAQAVFDLMNENPNVVPGSLRHLAVGTESGLDHSKPVSAYVQGMLQRAGVGVPASLSSFQSQHACAGGTVALLGVAGLLAAAGRPGDSGLVIASDIARYQSKTTAEVTQGAGAVALHVESSPRLLELDLGGAGFHSQDVDDFFRPIGASVPTVSGGYSMRCYEQSLEAAFKDHCSRTGQQPAGALADVDFFVLHTPFHSMPEMALQKLVMSQLGLTAEQTRTFLEQRGFYESIAPLARIGNIYTASMYAVLAFLLEHQLRVMGDAIVGKRILLASYGSGNTMIVFSARIAEEAPGVIARWNLGRVLTGSRSASFEEYEGWLEGAQRSHGLLPLVDHSSLPADAFFLAGIRKDGYREYGKTDARKSWVQQGETAIAREPVAAIA